MSFAGYNAQGSLNTAGTGVISRYNKWLFVQYMKYGYAEALMFGNSKFWPMLKKQASRDKGGKNMTCPILVSGSQAHSKNFMVAQALSEQDTGDPSVETWVGNRDRDYAVDAIEEEEWLSAQNNFATFKNKRKLKIDQAIRAMSIRKEAEMWGLGKNKLGEIESAASQVITLKSPEQAYTIEKNAYIEIRSPAGVARAGGTTIGGLSNCFKVDKVEYGTSITNSSKITILAAHALPGTVAAGDFIYKAGDYGARSIASIQEWLPLTAPGSSDSFFGVNRSQQVERLAGFRSKLSDHSSRSVHQEIRRLTTTVNTFSKMPGFTGYFMNPFTENWLVNTVENRNATTGNVAVQYQIDTSKPGGGTSANLGLGRLRFNTAGGEQYPVYLSMYIPLGLIYGLNMNTFMLKYLAPKGQKMLDFVRDGKGSAFYLRDTKMTYETRMRMYAQLFLQLPGSCFVLDAKAEMESAGY